MLSENSLALLNDKTARLMGQFAGATEITTDPEYACAGDYLRNAATLIKEIDEAVGPAVAAAHKAHKTACDLKSSLKKPVEDAINSLKNLMSRFDAKKRAEAAAAQAELNKRLREEQERLALVAAQKLEQEANAAKAAGDTAAAEMLTSMASATLDVPVVTVPVATTTPAVEGISRRVVWKWRLVDEAKIPREYLVVNDAAVGKVVTALKDKTEIPGIEVYPEDAITVRSR
jgi:hypothetical protein